jgi:hypothetical protein
VGTLLSSWLISIAKSLNVGASGTQLSLLFFNFIGDFMCYANTLPRALFSGAEKGPHKYIGPIQIKLARCVLCNSLFSFHRLN